MPTSVLELFSSVGLFPEEPVKWGQSLPPRTSSGPGVYVVALSSSPEDKTTCLVGVPPLDLDEIGRWVEAVPKLTVDGVRPVTEELVSRIAERLGKYWLPDEPILYIGTTSRTVKRRVCEFYCTDLGERSPHRGGHWLKTLSILDRLYVFWALTPEAKDIESQLLQTFAERTLADTSIALDTKNGSLPFANLTPRARKKHKIKHQVKD